MSANDIQFGGDHYKTEADVLQHWDICEIYGIGYMESAGTKYVYRHESKNGLEDVLKAFHYTTKLIELHDEYNRRPRGIVPLKVLNRWVMANKLDCFEAEYCYLMFRWETVDHLVEAQNKVRNLIRRKYPDFDLSQLD
jgi:hypothetical protein